jgi:hypothetical protein
MALGGGPERLGTAAAGTFRERFGGFVERLRDSSSVVRDAGEEFDLAFGVLKELIAMLEVFYSLLVAG